MQLELGPEAVIPDGSQGAHRAPSQGKKQILEHRVGSSAHSWAQLEGLAVGSYQRQLLRSIFRCLAPAACPQEPGGWMGPTQLAQHQMGTVWEARLNTSWPKFSKQSLLLSTAPYKYTQERERREVQAPKVQPAHHPAVSMAAERRKGQGQAATGDISTCTLPATLSSSSSSLLSFSCSPWSPGELLTPQHPPARRCSCTELQERLEKA